MWKKESGSIRVCGDVMKRRICIHDIADYSKGQQINGDDLLADGKYDYLNGGINPSGKWSDYNVESGTVTISEGGNSSGYVNYMNSPFWCGAHCYYLYNVKGNTRYLYYALKSQQDKLMGIRSGACMPNIKKSDLGKFEVWFDTDINEQVKVIAVLEKVENIIQTRKRQLEAFDQLIKARFVEMFGDPIMNPKRYPVHQLSEYISSLTSGSRGWAQYCVENGTEWFITIKNVKDCHITTDNMQPVNAPDNAEAKRTKVQEGDLLISITADLGRTGVVTKEIAEHGAYINQHLSCIRVNKEVLHPLFVAHYMESPAGKEQFTAKNQSAVKAGLNFNSINSLKLYVPPLKEQEEFITFITQVTKSKVAVQKALDGTQLLFDSLMQQYFG